MRTLVLLAAIEFILVHGPNDHAIAINAAEISSIRQRDANDSFDDDVKCVLIMTNGKWNGVVETCLDVIKLIVDADKRK